MKKLFKGDKYIDDSFHVSMVEYDYGHISGKSLYSPKRQGEYNGEWLIQHAHFLEGMIFSNSDHKIQIFFYTEDESGCLCIKFKTNIGYIFPPRSPGLINDVAVEDIFMNHVTNLIESYYYVINNYDILCNKSWKRKAIVYRVEFHG